MKIIKAKSFYQLLFGSLIIASFASCETGGGGGGSSFDFGDNDPNVVVAMGDSITDGVCVPAGAPYPDRVAALSGKRVINQGSCGEKSSEGASRVNSVLNSANPGYLFILYGTNDALYGDPSAVKENLRAMIQAAKNNKTLPVIATLTPMYDKYAYGNSDAKGISREIRNLANEEGIPLVDLEAEFGSDRSLTHPDGVHLSDSGTQLIALSFNDQL